ncbi:MAG: carbamoyltransferase [Desulfobaccales bacterium]|nr:carbamoyltransferase [Desulfobaccales bacterium]
MPDAILGLSAFYHDSAAAILVDGQIVAAAQEERFSRKKHDPSFPAQALAYVLAESGLKVADLSAVAFYDKPYLKFERLLETYHGFAPRGLRSFVMAMPVWIKEKLLMRKLLRDELAKAGPGKPPLLFPEHHLSHAASAFYPSPFKEAAILTIDGVGEWSTSTIGFGQGREISILRELHFPHSLGLLYSAFTYYCGFKVNSGEYKLMGLAPYGNPEAEQTQQWKNLILDELVDLREDGSILLNMDYFDFATGLTMCRDEVWQSLFGIPRRPRESKLDQRYMNLALAVQQATEEIVLRLADTAKKLTGADYLVMAGGVALNCVANGKLLRRGTFKDLWIQPAAGDAGGALGAALAAWHISKGQERQINSGLDHMQGSYLGPEFDAGDILRVARRYQAPYQVYQDFDQMCGEVAALLAQGQVVGWFQGRMEWGPRALGNRSILGDPRHPEMQKRLNLKIKYREGFRPFAPSVLFEETKNYFGLDRPSPYMLLVAPVQEPRRQPLPPGYENLELYERLYHLRSDIPAVTHVDYSARIQTVHKETNEKYWRLIQAFKEQTGCGVIVNTSFNVRGEPIVCTPEDAYQCFMRTEMDYLVMGDFLFDKKAQPPWREEKDWRQEYELD